MVLNKSIKNYLTFSTEKYFSFIFLKKVVNGEVWLFLAKYRMQILTMH